MHETTQQYSTEEQHQTEYGNSRDILNQLLRYNETEEGMEQEDPQNDHAESPSASSKDVGPESPERDTQSPVTLSSDMAQEIFKQLQFLSHQVVRLIKDTGRTPCSCPNCTVQLNKNTVEASSSADHSAPTTPFNDHSHGLNSANKLNNISNGNCNEIEYYEDGTLKRGRKSKYCSAATKIECASYAEKHGAAAAGRKFGIPAQVAAYYCRKLKKPKQDSVFQSLTSLQSQPQRISKQSSLDTDGNNENFEFSEPSTPRLDASDLFSRTPHLRGRGRGRPKLIGDDLDAELVDYMVGIKKRVPRGHLSANYALEVARAYIVDKAPHILEENGGHVSLKMTWAMKLVSRTNDRYKELYGEFDPALHGLNIPNNTAHQASTSPIVPGEQNLTHESQMSQQQEIVDYLNQLDNQEITNVRELDVYKINSELKQEVMHNHCAPSHINMVMPAYNPGLPL